MSDVPEQDTKAKQQARFSNVTSGVFGLILVLSAFSLTNVPIDSVGDVWNALSVFTPAFFFVVVIWQVTSVLSDRYPDGDPFLYAGTTAVLFLTTLAPVFLNLLLNDQPEIQQLSATLFPLSLAIIFGILSLLWLRLGMLIRRNGQEPDPSIRTSIGIEAAVVLIFLGSLLLPWHDAGYQARTLAWLTAFVVPQAFRWLYPLVGATRRTARSNHPAAPP
jgi:uncharacterized membrane protein